MTLPDAAERTRPDRVHNQSGLTAALVLVVVCVGVVSSLGAPLIPAPGEAPTEFRERYRRDLEHQVLRARELAGDPPS